MQLTDGDRAILEGEAGEASRLAMELVVAVGRAAQAPRLLDITGAHIDSCLYHGRAGLDFALRLVQGGGKTRVPATLNVASLDLLHPELYRGPSDLAEAGRALMDAYVTLGCTPTWTCAPYQLSQRPGRGEQIAWGESNAIVFANSVLGARTERYGDFLDISCALTGRAPAVGLHTDEGRLATVVVEVDLPDRVLDDDLAYPAIGHVLGQIAGTRVAALIGLDSRADEDRLKSLGAAAASSGAVAMFHVVGVTPEADTLDRAMGGRETERRDRITLEDLIRARRSLSTSDGPLGAVSVGTPHFSVAELTTLSGMVRDLRSRVPFYVNTSRHSLETADAEQVIAPILSFGATLVTDTCTYITPVMAEVDGVVMTNSGKWAYYAPGNLGVEVHFAGLEACVEAAVSGRVVEGEEW